MELLENQLNLRPVNDGIFSVHGKQVYQGHEKREGLKLKTLRTVDGYFKLVVDYGFKGNARFADDKSDYYILDLHTNKIYGMEEKDFRFIKNIIQKVVDEIKKPKIQAFLTNDFVVLSQLIHNMTLDNWVFETLINGVISVKNEDEVFEFEDADKYYKWLMEKAEEY